MPHLHPNEERRLTGRREHLLAGEHGIRSCHKAHRLLRLAQRLSSSGEADDCLGKDNSGSRDRSEHSLERYRLSNPVSTTGESRV